VKKTLSFLLKLAVSLTLLYYLFRRTDFSLLWQSFKGLSWSWFFISVVSFFLFQLISTFRWQKINFYLGFKKPFFYFCRVYFIGIYFNTFLPGLLGGDIVRVFYLVKAGAAKSVASFSVLYDRAFGLLGALFLLLIFIPLVGNFLPPLACKTLLLLSAGGLGVALLFTLSSRFLREKVSHELFQTLLAVTPWPKFSVLFLLGLAVQVAYNIHLIFLARSLGIEPEWARFFLIIPLMGILASLPISLGGFGVREGTLSYFLELLGYPPELGIALGFLTYGVMLIGGTIGGFLYLGGGRPKDGNF